uniref:Uncharacterized protein n=1 Tax=Mycena chlorophos TaxID=658473 RepID=A0ABQ0LGU0_MYCCL|nr:predicted protein [Mycena chlorophos]
MSSSSADPNASATSVGAAASASSSQGCTEQTSTICGLGGAGDLYLLTFIGTLIILLLIASFMVARGYIRRRRLRALGLPVDNARPWQITIAVRERPVRQGRHVLLGPRPEMFDLYVDAEKGRIPMKEASESIGTWGSFLPISATFIPSPENTIPATKMEPSAVESPSESVSDPAALTPVGPAPALQVPGAPLPSAGAGAGQSLIMAMLGRGLRHARAHARTEDTNTTNTTTTTNTNSNPLSLPTTLLPISASRHAVASSPGPAPLSIPIPISEADAAALAAASAVPIPPPPPIWLGPPVARVACVIAMPVPPACDVSPSEGDRVELADGDEKEEAPLPLVELGIAHVELHAGEGETVSGAEDDVELSS